jgi:hypothetical protein
MALWNKNDLENSKPSWLTEEQKRQCFRTVRGWEIPMAGIGFSADAETIFGTTANGTTGIPYLYRSPSFVGMTELLVAMPMDSSGATNASSTGIQSPDYAGIYNSESRGYTSNYGATNGGDLPNYKPYFTAPTSSVSGTTGATIYATIGITSYIPVIVADANVTDVSRRFVFSLTGSVVQGLTGITLIQGLTVGTFTTLYSFIGATSGTVSLTGSALTTRQSLVLNQPTNVVGMTAAGQVWDYATKTANSLNRYGGWGGITQGAAVLVVSPTAVTGNYPIRLNVFDGRAINGVTGSINFVLNITSGTAF